MSTPTTSGNAAPANAAISGVRFLLSELLGELELERAAGTFVKAKLDQREIRKLFKAKASRRVRPAK